MNYKSIISSLYYLLIYADGKINEREVSLGKLMMKEEGFDDSEFDSLMELFKRKDRTVLLAECIAGLKKQSLKQQIRAIGWLCVIANADGFMDKEEWLLIYKIYNVELHLSLDDILKEQKELNKVIHGKSFLSFGVKVKE
jgi:uncharacterized tellurite resistance protein B-like protein